MKFKNFLLVNQEHILLGQPIPDIFSLVCKIRANLSEEHKAPENQEQ